MAVTNKTLSDIHIFPTEALYNTNSSSILDTDLALVMTNGLGNASDISMGENGYIKFDNGMIIQWGFYAESNGISDQKYFPIAFPNQCFVAVTSHLDWSGHLHSSYQAWIEIIDNTKFLIGLDSDVSQGTITDKRIGMIAIGY